MAGLVVVSVVVVLLLEDGGDDEETGVGWLKLGIGSMFLLMAARQWQKRPRGGEQPAMPAWMATVDSASPSRAVVIGALLAGANPKNLALTLAAAASIAEAWLDTPDTAIAVVTFVAIGSATVMGAVLAYLADAEKAARPLAVVRRFMSDNNAVIMMVVLLLLGAKLVGDGLGGVRR